MKLLLVCLILISPLMAQEPVDSLSNDTWGWHTLIDMEDCDPELIRCKSRIHAFAIVACRVIDAKRYGDPLISNFGEDERVAGYSLVQLIETSLISGHFVNATNAAYIDIFSCKKYDSAEIIECALTSFRGKLKASHLILRK